MSFVSGFKNTATKFENMAERSTAKARKAMEAGAELIRDDARRFAPVDEGHLEQNINVKKYATGINRRFEFAVEVDDANTPSGNLHSYFFEVHEGIGKNYGQGPRSIEKALRLGVFVGPKFLERAYNRHVQAITKNVQDAIKASL